MLIHAFIHRKIPRSLRHPRWCRHRQDVHDCGKDAISYRKKIYAPEKIVCLTFSNEAVASLQRRISTAIPSLAPPSEPIIRTFHSFCADILHTHGSKIGIRESFRLLLPDDAKILLHKSFKLHPRLCIKYIDTIGIAKDLGITHHDLDAYLTKKLAEKILTTLSTRSNLCNLISTLCIWVRTAKGLNGGN